MNIKRKHFISSAASIVILLFIFSGAMIATAGDKDIHKNKDKDYEETALNVLDSDEVITGIMEDFSNKTFHVNGRRYTFCKDIMIRL